MARTNATAVGLIVDTNLDTTAIDAFIEDATLIVDRLAADCGSLSTAELTMIEKYMAAHLLTAREARIKHKRRGDVTDVYQRDGEMSEYLKAAIGMDPCGVLKQMFDPPEDQVALSFRVGAGYDSDLDLPATEDS